MRNFRKFLFAFVFVPFVAWAQMPDEEVEKPAVQPPVPPPVRRVDPPPARPAVVGSAPVGDPTVSSSDPCDQLAERAKKAVDKNAIDAAAQFLGIESERIACRTRCTAGEKPMLHLRTLTRSSSSSSSSSSRSSECPKECSDRISRIEGRLDELVRQGVGKSQPELERMFAELKRVIESNRGGGDIPRLEKLLKQILDALCPLPIGADPNLDFEMRCIAAESNKEMGRSGGSKVVGGITKAVGGITGQLKELGKDVDVLKNGLEDIRKRIRALEDRPVSASGGGP